MSNDEQDIEKVVLTRLLRMNAVLAGVTTGAVIGLGIFLATNYLVLKGGSVIGPHLNLLGQFFWGYNVTFQGSLIGLAYGFLSGFVVGYVVARIYNWLADFREARRSPEP